MNNTFVHILAVLSILTIGNIVQASCQDDYKKDANKLVKTSHASQHQVTDREDYFIPNEILSIIIAHLYENSCTKLTPSSSKDNKCFLAARHVSKNWNNLIRTLNLTKRIKFKVQSNAEFQEWKPKYNDLRFKDSITFNTGLNKSFRDSTEVMEYFNKFREIYPLMNHIHLEIEKNTWTDFSTQINRFLNELSDLKSLNFDIHPNSFSLRLWGLSSREDTSTNLQSHELHSYLLSLKRLVSKSDDPTILQKYGFSKIAAFTNLQYLNLFRVEFVQDDIEQLSTLTNLTTLNLPNKLGDRTDLNALSPFVKLTSLNINSNLNIKDFSALSRLTKLQELKIDDTNVTDAQVVHLTSLTNLVRLDLSKKSVFGNKITNQSLGVFIKLINLEQLSLKGQNIQDNCQFEKILKGALPKLRNPIF